MSNTSRVPLVFSWLLSLPLYPPLRLILFIRIHPIHWTRRVNKSACIRSPFVCRKFRDDCWVWRPNVWCLGLPLDLPLLWTNFRLGLGVLRSSRLALRTSLGSLLRASLGPNVLGSSSKTGLALGVLERRGCQTRSLRTRRGRSDLYTDWRLALAPRLSSLSLGMLSSRLVLALRTSLGSLRMLRSRLALALSTSLRVLRSRLALALRTSLGSMGMLRSRLALALRTSLRVLRSRLALALRTSLGLSL